MPNERSYPTSVQFNEQDYKNLEKAGLHLEVKKFESVRLEGMHFDAIETIIRSLPSSNALRSRAGRSSAIRVAAEKFCEQLTVDAHYDSLTTLVKDALIWYAEELDKSTTPF